MLIRMLRYECDVIGCSNKKTEVFSQTLRDDDWIRIPDERIELYGEDTYLPPRFICPKHGIKLRPISTPDVIPK